MCILGFVWYIDLMPLLQILNGCEFPFLFTLVSLCVTFYLFIYYYYYYYSLRQGGYVLPCVCLPVCVSVSIFLATSHKNY